MTEFSFALLMMLAVLALATLGGALRPWGFVATAALTVLILLVVEVVTWLRRRMGCGIDSGPFT